VLLAAVLLRVGDCESGAPAELFGGLHVRDVERLRVVGRSRIAVDDKSTLGARYHVKRRPFP
jgi:hypothetical protein